MVKELMVSAAMGIQVQSGGTGSHSASAAGNGVSLSSGLHSVSGTQLMDQFSSADDYAPKVRKPYTITKQRERWTEEEHMKFLEALKLYGRVWRKIEEHVATKTAVQIRSHAQKFFSKIVRDSNGGNPIESVEIPPPRPKRKPMHPYPRKFVKPPNVKTLKPKSPMRPSSPNDATCDHERSPTSVLSAFASETFGSIESDTLNGSLSPMSTFTSDKDGILLQDGRLASTQFTISTAKPPMMNSPLFPGSYVNPVEETAGTRILKLFGRTVMVADSRPQALPTMVTSRSSTPEMREQGYGQSSILKFTKVEASLDSAQCSENSMREEPNNTAYHMQHQSDASNSEDAHAAASVLCSFMPNRKQELDEKQLDSCAGVQTREFQNETSWTDSSTEFVINWQKSESSESETESTKRSNLIKASECYVLSEVRTKCERSKGFVPYKRCASERHGFCSMMSSEERAEQRFRLSL